MKINTMQTHYINSKGDKIEIAGMHDNYLWSAYNKYKQRATALTKAINEKRVTVSGPLFKNRRNLEALVTALETELKNRGLR